MQYLLRFRGQGTDADGMTKPNDDKTELMPALSQNLPAHLRGFQASKGYPTDRTSGDLKDDTRFFQAPVPNMIRLRPLVAFPIVFVVTLSFPPSIILS